MWDFGAPGLGCVVAAGGSRWLEGGSHGACNSMQSRIFPQGPAWLHRQGRREGLVPACPQSLPCHTACTWSAPLQQVCVQQEPSSRSQMGLHTRQDVADTATRMTLRCISALDTTRSGPEQRVGHSMLQAFGLELLQAHACTRPAIYPFAGSRRPRGPMSKTSSWCSTRFRQARRCTCQGESVCCPPGCQSCAHLLWCM